MKEHKIIDIISRYFILLIFVYLFGFTRIISDFLVRVTLFCSNFAINLIYGSRIYENTIITGNFFIEIIPACAAVSAYLLLITLNITTSMSLVRRLWTLAFSLLSLFIINIIRIALLAILFINESKYYNDLHHILWYIISTLFIIGLWFLTAYIFKIRNIPVYSDIKTIISKNVK